MSRLAITGFLAGKVATAAFARLWRLVDDQASPAPNQRAVRWPKLIVALALEGAIFRAAREAFRSRIERAVQAGDGNLARR